VDHTEIMHEGTDWFCLAQDRVKCWAFVTAIRSEDACLLKHL
jgi:hypothetical protein